MPDATRYSYCNHCDEAAVVPVEDAKHNRTIFVCFECRWWGTKPDAIANPLPDKALVKIVWPDDSQVTVLFPEKN